MKEQRESRRKEQENEIVVSAGASGTNLVNQMTVMYGRSRRFTTRLEAAIDVAPEAYPSVALGHSETPAG